MLQKCCEIVEKYWKNDFMVVLIGLVERFGRRVVGFNNGQTTIPRVEGDVGMEILKATLAQK